MSFLLRDCRRRATEFLTGWNYIYGYKYGDNTVTEQHIMELASQYPKVFTPSYINRAKTYIGGYAIDCSGLVCWVLGIKDIGSYYIARLDENRPTDFTSATLDEVMEGDILCKEGHVGYYLGDGKVLEARSMSAGVNVFSVTSNKWTKVIRPNYEDEEELEKEEMYDKKGWINDGDKWWYSPSGKKGDYLKSTFAVIDDKLYAFDENGYMLRVGIFLTSEKGDIIGVKGYN